MSTAASPRTVRPWLAAAFAVAAAWQLVVTLQAAAMTRHDLLRWDDVGLLWHEMQQPLSEFGLRTLFALHNEHRIVFPRLLAMLDTSLVDASGQVMFAALLLLQGLHVAVLVALFRRCANPSTAADAPGPIPTMAFFAAGRLAVLGATPSERAALVDTSALAGRLDAEPTIIDVWTKPGELSWYLPPPDAGPVFDSWAGSDRNRGQCHFGPVAVAASSLGIPVLIGPDASGQQVRVVDAETGAVLARAPVSALRGCWRIWRVDLDAGIRRIAVEAEDDGAGWGQWTALGEPRWLR